MPYADPQVQKAHVKRMATNRQAAMRAHVAAEKSQPCSDCGGSFPPVCMDYDHRDPHTKTREISRILSRGASWASLRTELDKCDLVCANCHRIRESRRRETAPDNPELSRKEGDGES